MRIDEFEFRNKQGEEIEPTKDQLVIYIKSLHKQVADLETKLADLQQEQIKEMQEHQEAMELADKTIKATEEQNKRVLEKLELIVSANQELEQKLAERERQYETLYKLFSEQHEIIDQNELECFEEVNRLLKEQKEFYVVEKAEYDKMKQGAKDIVDKLKQQLTEKDEAHMKAMENALNDFLTLRQELNQDKISFAVEQLSTLRNFVNSKTIFSKNECEREVCRDISQTIDNRIKRLEEGEWT